MTRHRHRQRQGRRQRLQRSTTTTAAPPRRHDRRLGPCGGRADHDPSNLLRGDVPRKGRQLRLRGHRGGARGRPAHPAPPLLGWVDRVAGLAGRCWPATARNAPPPRPCETNSPRSSPWSRWCPDTRMRSAVPSPGSASNRTCAPGCATPAVPPWSSAVADSPGWSRFLLACTGENPRAASRPRRCEPGCWTPARTPRTLAPCWPGGSRTSPATPKSQTRMRRGRCGCRGCRHRRPASLMTRSVPGPASRIG